MFRMTSSVTSWRGRLWGISGEGRSVSMGPTCRPQFEGEREKLMAPPAHCTGTLPRSSMREPTCRVQHARFRQEAGQRLRRFQVVVRPRRHRGGVAGSLAMAGVILGRTCKRLDEALGRYWTEAQPTCDDVARSTSWGQSAVAEPQRYGTCLLNRAKSGLKGGSATSASLKASRKPGLEAKRREVKTSWVHLWAAGLTRCETGHRSSRASHATEIRQCLSTR